MAESAARHTQTWRQEATTRVFVAFIAICLALAALGRWSWPAAESMLRYERDGVLHGELWRLVTAHLVHGDTRHLAFNMLGTAMLAVLFPHTYSTKQWLGVLASSALVIDLGFLLLEPSLSWYVGASGVLHGVLAAGAIAWLRSGHRWAGAILGALLLVKLAWEQTHGALSLVTSLPVIVDAHAYGTLGGLLAGIAVRPDAGAGRAQRASL